MVMPERVLIVDDEPDSKAALALLLSSWGYEVFEADDGAQALDLAVEYRPAVIVSDLVMPGMDGLALLEALRAELPASSVILLTGHATVETAVSAMKEGAYDYLTKPVDVRRLRMLVAKAAEKSEVLREVTLLRRQLGSISSMGPLIGSSAPMQEVYRIVHEAASTSAPVLVAGESGTGKELVARTIHTLSTRGKGPFVAINCSAIPESLLESELFGHERGAFTGALERRAGYFELADQGTLFLDEIAEMSAALQAKYLRALQDGVIRRLGGKAELKVDVRVIAATNKDPVAAMREGTLREDLYYRLNVFSLTMPTLRERKEDIALLADAFIAEFSAKYAKPAKALSEEALELLKRHSWPGNVRELRNCIERAVIGCEDAHIPASLLSVGGLRPVPSPPSAPADTLAAAPDGGPPAGITLDEAERILILKTLAVLGNNKTRAAETLGISLKTLHNKLRRYSAS
jgi:DNA-binding NtrC family response regulator